MLSSFVNIFKIPELKRRIFFTFGLLAVYRIGAHIPTPGIDGMALAEFFKQAQGTLLGFFDMFSGGALLRMTIFALGIMPYISASIIIQLLTVVIPHLERLAKEGDAGRRVIVRYTRYGTVGLAAFQSFAISVGLEQMTSPGGAPIVPFPGWGFRFMTVISLTAGTAFIMWLGEQITERGIGNGISLIIFAGIVARMPTATVQTFSLVRTGEISVFLMLFVLVIMVGAIALIIFMERGQRRIPVQYAKRVVGRKMYGGQSTHLPLKVNTSGVIPPIFASSILMFPATVAGFIKNPIMEAVANTFAPGRALYTVLYVGLIIFFCYFYTAIQFNPVDVAENLKKYGGYIPGIRPGRKTSEYIDRVLSRITFGGALYLSMVCVLPEVLYRIFNVPFYFGGTGLLIVIGVALDTVTQVETHLVTRHYEGFMKKGRIKGRR
ncbi:MAG: preprotein translocase subunit SecY [bacterium]|nr:preprotein translocase subunit SecY [bacterium]MDT8395900.1 preprotein translocase subunit SecY [bacterium]